MDPDPEFLTIFGSCGPLFAIKYSKTSLMFYLYIFIILTVKVVFFDKKLETKLFEDVIIDFLKVIV